MVSVSIVKDENVSLLLAHYACGVRTACSFEMMRYSQINRERAKENNTYNAQLLITIETKNLPNRARDTM